MYFFRQETKYYTAALNKYLHNTSPKKIEMELFEFYCFGRFLSICLIHSWCLSLNHVKQYNIFMDGQNSYEWVLWNYEWWVMSEFWPNFVSRRVRSFFRTPNAYVELTTTHKTWPNTQNLHWNYIFCAFLNQDRH